jgi:hypothetical protein
MFSDFVQINMAATVYDTSPLKFDLFSPRVCCRQEKIVPRCDTPRPFTAPTLT